jgi:hypothetical protein
MNRRYVFEGSPQQELLEAQGYRVARLEGDSDEQRVAVMERSW